ncbi:di-heme oxidoredictase family protein [Piscinibacter sp.]|uniref:di-heme oxidoredictase family protein n=1 Tax=Piscinibacter sp. TaxID=1903157 RepID=UPI0039E623A6
MIEAPRLRAAAAALATTLGLVAACGGGDDPYDGGGGGGGGNLAVPDWAVVTALGDATTNTTANQANRGFDTPAPNLDTDGLALHLAGDVDFEQNFLKAPSTDFPVVDGLGPVHNNIACIRCHASDGRAAYTSAVLNSTVGEWTKLGSEAGVFLRISVNGQAACTPSAANRYCAPQAVPGFSDQLFHRSVLGVRPDSEFSGQADVYVSFERSTVNYGDGTPVTLYKPLFRICNPYDDPGEAKCSGGASTSALLQAGVSTSPRMGMPTFGLGLLEAIPESAILALADENDANGDGISGRPNWVFDPVKAAQGNPEPRSLGRFGWKASTPSVLVQGAGAYRGDMGITNYLFPDESIAGTPLYDAYRAANPDDDGQAASGYEASEEVVKRVIFYNNTLAVPARRDVSASDVRRGAALFVDAKCSVCHNPSFTTGTHPGIWGPSGTTPVAAVANQRIYPFTDMLLHDMGEGLADQRSDFGANGSEWKTRPLWGIGLTHVVNSLAGFLHDGRARTLEEAILWHGGEAEASKERFRTMSAADRAALVAFLKSL